MQQDRTDDELRLKRLCINDPRLEDVVVGKVAPSELELDAIVYGHDFRRERISCAIPGCSAKHHKGFIVQLKSGRKIIVGHKCARDHFGIDWEAEVARHDRDTKRQDALLSLDAIRPSLAGGLAAAYQLDAIVDMMDKRQKSLEMTLGGLWFELRRQVSDGSDVLSYQRLIAGSAFADARERQGKKTAMSETVTVGRLSGAAFVRIVELPRSLKAAKTALHAAQSLAGSSHNVESIKLTRAVSAAQRALSTIRGFADIAKASDAFLTPPNFALIARWAEHISRDAVLSFDGEKLWNSRLNTGLRPKPIPRTSAANLALDVAAVVAGS